MIFFQISCGTHKDNWSIKKLLIMCVQEDQRLRHKCNTRDFNKITKNALV